MTNEEEVRAMATQMVTAIKQIWPEKDVTTVIMALVESQVRLLRVAGNLKSAEALDALIETLNHIKESELALSESMEAGGGGLVPPKAG